MSLSRQGVYAIGAVAVILAGGITGCSAGDTTTGEPPATSPTSATTLSPAPTDFASLDAGDLIPAGQEDAAKAAGVGLVHLPQTDPDHDVVVTPGQELPEAVQDEIKATTDPLAVIDTTVDLVDAGVRVIFLSEVVFPSTGESFLQFSTTARAGEVPGWDEEHNPVTEQGSGFKTRAEAMAFIQPWLKDFPVKVYDLTK